MDEIVVAQNKYISSKRASRLTGYAQDYIGQLVRLGKVNATKVGKAWFVDEAGLMRHISGSSRLVGPVKELADVETRPRKVYSSSVTAGINYPQTWKPITYMHDNSPLSPISDSRDSDILIASSRDVDADLNGTENTKVKISRQYSAPRGILVAGTVDGVRFSAPERAVPSRVDEKSLPGSQILLSRPIISVDIAQSAAISEPPLTPRRGQGAVRFIAYTTLIFFVMFLIPVVV